MTDRARRAAALGVGALVRAAYMRRRHAVGEGGQSVKTGMWSGKTGTYAEIGRMGSPLEIGVRWGPRKDIQKLNNFLII